MKEIEERKGIEKGKDEEIELKKRQKQTIEDSNKEKIKKRDKLREEFREKQSEKFAAEKERDTMKDQVKTLMSQNKELQEQKAQKKQGIVEINETIVKLRKEDEILFKKLNQIITEKETLMRDYEHYKVQSGEKGIEGE